MALGDYRHTVHVENPGPPVADADGGFTQTWSDAVPAYWPCSIDPATTRDLERVAAGTILATASHVVKGRYHPQITTQTRLMFGTREFHVTGVSNPQERNIQTVALCEEVVA